MKSLFVCCCWMLCWNSGFTQSNDFLLLKKKHRTIRRLFAGQYLQIGIDQAGPYECLIREVYKDSLKLMFYNTYTSQTSYGGVYVDTVNRYSISVHYSKLTTFYHDRNKHFNLSGSGGTLIGAGILGLLATGVNAAYLKQPLFTGGTPWFAVGSAALAGIGYWLFKASSKPIEIGKKYKLVYINVSP